jgi:hypothetical protein
MLSDPKLLSSFVSETSTLILALGIPTFFANNISTFAEKVLPVLSFIWKFFFIDKDPASRYNWCNASFFNFIVSERLNTFVIVHLVIPEYQLVPVGCGDIVFFKRRYN